MNRAAVAFWIRALGLSVGLFGLLRLPWIETHLLWPFTSVQARTAALAGGAATVSRVGLDCSGADAIALCLAFVLAWPAGLTARLLGALGGVTFISAINIVRIVTLLRMDGSPRFALWHEILWPALLTTASVGYVFAWMSRAGRSRDDSPRGGLGAIAGGRPFGRLLAATIVCVLAFFGTLPLYLESAPVAALAGWMASAAAAVMNLFGAFATASGGVLTTSRGGFHVTGECVATPLIPLGVAAALTLPSTWRRRLLAALAVGPVFVLLGIARLLVLALPSAVIASPELWVHAFFQILLAVVAVAVVTAWHHRDDAARWTSIPRRTATAVSAGLVASFLLGFSYSDAVQAAGTNLAATLVGLGSDAPPDPQRAFALLPPFQIGFFIALTIGLATGWKLKTWMLALGALVASQVTLFAVVHGASALAGAEIPVPGIRLWAVAAPLGILLVYRRQTVDPAEHYVAFWDDVGRQFPDLGGAPSTDYYFASEMRLLSEHLPDLAGARLLKTDLWDEARNTRILQWAARRDAVAFGIDIALSTIAQAHREFTTHRLCAAAADVRHLPFADGQFDAVYSMGTIEHFDDSDVAVGEIFRVLRPGGRAIVGVPNRWDPFLRPLQVRLMQHLGIYGYGAERSFSRRALRKMLQSKGFEVVAETGILFMPGWLRMLDLACHAWWPPLVPLTRAMVSPFVALDRRFASLRNHGYLIATVVRKPAR